MKFMASAYKEAFDEGGFAWDDASNNRAFLSNTCRSTSNGASIYLLAQKQARHLPDREGDAAQGRYFPHTAAQGCSWSVQLSRAVLESGHGLFEEPEGGQGFPQVDLLEGDL